MRRITTVHLGAEDEERLIQPSGVPGLSAAVIVEFCKLVRYPCHVIHKDRKIYEWMPEGYETGSRAQLEDTPRIMFNVHSDHASFYERSAGQAITRMKVVEPKRTRPYRLACHPSDTSRFRRATFQEMREFTLEGPRCH